MHQDIFCIFFILQYAEYSKYGPCTIILHIILYMQNMQNSLFSIPSYKIEG
jgi:hypothetical protein